MKLGNIIWLTVALTLILSLFLVWFLPTSADLVPENPFWNGLEDFSHKTTAQIAESLDRLGRPQDTVLIAMPYTPYRQEELEQIKQFVGAGGSLAILDDFGYGNSILAYLGLESRFSGILLLDPLFNLKNAEFPLVTYFGDRLKEKGLKAIALNRPSTLLDVEPDSVLARSLELSFLDSNGNGTMDKDETRGSLPVAAEIALGQGKVVLISDASIVINSMINKEDNYRFLQETLGIGEKHVIIDRSHIPSSVLDRTKRGLAQVRAALAGKYTIIALAFLFLFLALSPLWSQKNIKDVNGQRRKTT